MSVCRELKYSFLFFEMRTFIYLDYFNVHVDFFSYFFRLATQQSLMMWKVLKKESLVPSAPPIFEYVRVFECAFWCSFASYVSELIWMNPYMIIFLIFTNGIKFSITISFLSECHGFWDFRSVFFCSSKEYLWFRFLS